MSGKIGYCVEYESIVSEPTNRLMSNEKLSIVIPRSVRKDKYQMFIVSI